MARIRGVDPSKQRLLNRLFTRIVYVMTNRKVGGVVMPVQLVSHHPRLLWGYGQMEQSFASSHLVGADLKDLATLRVATLVGCPFELTSVLRAAEKTAFLQRRSKRYLATEPVSCSRKRKNRFWNTPMP
jgi:hypothetical protein